MYQRVKAYVEAYHMLGKEDRVIAGISGGADSICLLFVLLELKKELGFDLVAVHVHHGLRGEAADRDEDYVRQVCTEQKLSLIHIFTDYNTVKTMDLDQAKAAGLYQTIGAEVDDGYISELKKQVIHQDAIDAVGSELKIVYSPLHGTGNCLLYTSLLRESFTR